MRYFGVLAASAVLIGCSDVESGDLLTSGMYADLSVVATGDGTSKTQAVLKAGGEFSTTYVELTDDDQLTTSIDGGEPVAMTELELLDWHGYVAEGLPTDAPEAVFEIVFTRTIDEGAPSSTMSLPAPFALGTLPENQSRASDLVLTWTGTSTEPMSIAITGDCIQRYDGAVTSDAGTFTVPAGTILPIEGEEASSCAAALEVRRTKAGVADPAFEEGGDAYGVQLRTGGFQITE